MATEAKLQKYIEKLVATTKRFDQLNGYSPVAAAITTTDTRLQEIADLCRKLGGCMEDDFRKLIELVSEEKLPAPLVKKTGDQITWVKWAVIVCKTNPNSHDYPIGKPILVYYVDGSGAGGGRAHGVGAYHSEGNWLPDPKEAVRPATAEEIRKFVMEMVEHGDEYLERAYNND